MKAKLKEGEILPFAMEENVPEFLAPAERSFDSDAFLKQNPILLPGIDPVLSGGNN